MNNDKSLICTQSVNVYQGENADTIQFLLPTFYNNTDLSDCTVIVKYINEETNKGNIVNAELMPELYHKNFLDFRIPLNQDMTSKTGRLILWLEISNQNGFLLITNSTSVEIKPTKNIENHLSKEQLTLLKQYEVKFAQINNEIKTLLQEVLLQRNNAVQAANLAYKILEEIKQKVGESDGG